MQKTITRCPVSASDALRKALARSKRENERLRRQLCRSVARTMQLTTAEAMLLTEHYHADPDDWTSTAIREWLDNEIKEAT